MIKKVEDDIPVVDMNDPVDFQIRAKKILVDHIEKAHVDDVDKPVYDVYIIWFAKTLQNWKVIMSTTLPNGIIYELTYNGDQRETYIDTYEKTDNTVVPD